MASHSRLRNATPNFADAEVMDASGAMRHRRLPPPAAIQEDVAMPGSPATSVTTMPGAAHAVTPPPSPPPSPTKRPPPPSKPSEGGRPYRPSEGGGDGGAESLLLVPDAIISPFIIPSRPAGSESPEPSLIGMQPEMPLPSGTPPPSSPAPTNHLIGSMGHTPDHAITRTTTPAESPMASTPEMRPDARHGELTPITKRPALPTTPKPTMGERSPGASLESLVFECELQKQSAADLTRFVYRTFRFDGHGSTLTFWKQGKPGAKFGFLLKDIHGVRHGFDTPCPEGTYPCDPAKEFQFTFREPSKDVDGVMRLRAPSILEAERWVDALLGKLTAAPSPTSSRPPPPGKRPAGAGSPSPPAGPSTETPTPTKAAAGSASEGASTSTAAQEKQDPLGLEAQPLYQCVSKALVRKGFEQDSEMFGLLDQGRVIKVITSRLTADGIERLLFTHEDGNGWVSRQSKTGKVFMKKVTVPYIYADARTGSASS